MNNNKELIDASLKSISNQVKMLKSDENINNLEIHLIAQRLNILEKRLNDYTESVNS